MKLRCNYKTVELDGKIVAVPLSNAGSDNTVMLRMNDTAAFILDCLKNDTTENDIVEKVLKEYTGDVEEIKKYVHEYI